MAKIEYIRLPLEHCNVDVDAITYRPTKIVDPRTRLPIEFVLEGIPQLLWDNGRFWTEANCWLLRRSRLLPSKQIATDTVVANGKDLLAYANWLELQGMNWWACPLRDDQRPLNLFRGYLVGAYKDGVLSQSLASRRMATVKFFYRWLLAEKILSPGFPLWSERNIRIPYQDAQGFIRHIEAVQTSIDIKTSKRSNPDTGLEEGLQPVSLEVRDAILELAHRRMSRELYLMLSIGFWSGLRLGTIADLKIQTIENAVRINDCPELRLISVGPQANPPVKMKLDTSSDQIVIPTGLLDEIMDYSVSLERGKRVSLASPLNKNLLFLTKYGNSYGGGASDKSSTVNAELWRLKRIARSEDLNIDDFTFHWSRATFATMWARVARAKGLIHEFMPTLKRMLAHKHDRTTERYIRYVEKENVRAVVMDEFTKTMFGNYYKAIGDRRA